MEQQAYYNAVVTLMGKKILAGRITETTICGMRGIAVDVPEVDGYGGFVRTISYNAVYDIQPCTLDDVLDAVFDQRMTALPTWSKRRPQLKVVTYPVRVKFDLNGQRREAVVKTSAVEPNENRLIVALCNQGHADELIDDVEIVSWSFVDVVDPE